jgi:CheY-like chemotaxis protein
MTEDRPILVIDDDPSILDTVAEMLEFEGYVVQLATNGAEGLAAIERHMPSLVLLDMRMPVLDGWGFATRLREQGIEVAVVVMTAAQDAQRWATDISANGYLAKPFEYNDLLKTVRTNLVF